MSCVLGVGSVLYDRSGERSVLCVRGEEGRVGSVVRVRGGVAVLAAE